MGQQQKYEIEEGKSGPQGKSITGEENYYENKVEKYEIWKEKYEIKKRKYEIAAEKSGPRGKSITGEKKLLP